MKNLIIEWKHYDKESNTCLRCSKTGLSLRKAIDDLRDKLKKRGFRIILKEKKISEREIQASNSILFNGIPLENLLGNTKTVETPCNSCCKLIGSAVKCRALDYQGKITEDVSVQMIKKAVKSFISRKEAQ